MNVVLLTTGGTIEKVYNEADGSLHNSGSGLDQILSGLRLHGLKWRHVPVMSKDSLDMNDRDRQLILTAVREALVTDDAVLVLHGTDTLARTGELLNAELRDLKKPVILTGAMRPFEFRDTDAYQNLTEALLACRLVAPGVYAVMHNQVLPFPGVIKDRERMTLRKLP